MSEENTDLSGAIVPKSDQLNADDFIAGSKTITITKVEMVGGEQPVVVNFEGDDGKPYKPCKSMVRVMVHAWGADGKQFVGRSLSLFCDPTVKWGGMAVGGIRIGGMSHIDGPLTVNLTATRGKRKPFSVQPISGDTPEPAPKAPKTDPWIAWESEAGVPKGQLKDYMTANGMNTDQATLKEILANPAKYGDLVRGAGND